MAPFTELSLFSGAGGGLLGTTHLLGWRTVCYVEWDKYAVDVLKARIRDGYLHDAPIWDNAFTFDGRPWAGLVDVVTAGFPCQPFSVAGKGLSENDPRNGFPAVIRILREVRPRFALLENVPGLISKSYFKHILGQLSEAGFDTEYDCLSAAEIGANHKRERLWIFSDAAIARKGSIPIRARRSFEKSIDLDGSGEDVPDAAIERLEGAESTWSKRTNGRTAERLEHDWWAVEPELGRVADGISHRVDRLRAIGNGQVPAVVREAWRRLSNFE